jgi:hypothetical protein
METKISVVTKAKGHSELKQIPIIKISGEWLNKYGLEWKKLIAVKYKNKSIELELHNSDIDLKRIRSKDGFIRIGRDKTKKLKIWSQVHVKGYWLNDNGFPIGTVVVIKINNGKISIRALDMDSLQ